MCGIAGTVGLDASPETARNRVASMCDRIVHRGPDDAGYLVEPGICLGMRRLSIIDLEGGHQPVASEDEQVVVVFNGEIYNYRELRRDLIARGHRFRTDSDTETLVHLYEEHGDRMLDHLNGMFAFAIWDRRRSRLLLARDRIGIKPLYVWDVPGGGLAFASELKSLMVLPGFPSEPDPRAVAYYLAFGYVPDPMSIFAGVRKLGPGHCLAWDATDGVRERAYWSPVRPENAAIGEREAIEELRRLLSDAVRLRLVADVPLGAFLSGGIDSSSVVSAMGSFMDRPVRTFSIGFEERQFNEADDARAVAAHLGTDHTEKLVRPEVDALIERVVLAFDEPFADSSAIPTFLVSELARTEVTVALSGDGGDELFGGYTRYRDILSRDRDLPPSVRRGLRALGRALPHGVFGRNRILEYGRSRAGRYAGTVAASLDVDAGGVALPETAALVPNLDQVLDPWLEGVADRDLPNQMMLVDLQSYLPGDILTKVDRMSMAVSLEARVPLLDHRIVEFAVSLPSRLKIRGDGKWVLREAMRGRVPDFVFDKPKRGFQVPLRPWLRRELRHRVDHLLRADSDVYAYVDHRAVRRLVREHQARRRDHSTALWKLLVLDLWLSRRTSAPVVRESPPATLRT